MEPIQIVGIKELDDKERSTVNKLANRYYEKIIRDINNEGSITIVIKTHGKGGKQRKYGVHIKLSAPTRIFESTKAIDWDLARTMHKAFNDMEKQIQHHLHTDSQHNKPYE